MIDFEAKSLGGREGTPCAQSTEQIRRTELRGVGEEGRGKVAEYSLALSAHFRSLSLVLSSVRPVFTPGFTTTTRSLSLTLSRPHTHTPMLNERTKGRTFQVIQAHRRTGYRDRQTGSRGYTRLANGCALRLGESAHAESARAFIEKEARASSDVRRRGRLS